MANKPAPRNWSDVQVVIATGSMALALVLWNLFAGPDRASALKHAQEQAVLSPPQPIQEVTPAPVIVVQPTLPTGPILLGGNAPQTQIIVQTGGKGGGGGNGVGGGGAPVTSTGSS